MGRNEGAKVSGATTYINIIEPFLENVEKHPQRVACVCGEITQTYEQLDTLACKIARAFRNRGVETGDKVAYLMENSVELIAVYLAIQRIGAVAVPLNYRLIPREIAYLTNAVDAKLLVFAKKFEEKVVESRRDFNPELDLLAVGASTPFAPRLFDLSAPAEPDLELFRDEGALSRVQFTGGSTGLPKGACRTHGQDLAEIRVILRSNAMLEMDHPVVLIQCPLEHHGGHSWFMCALSAGATIVICGKFDAHAVLDQIDEHGVTHMILLPPTTYVRLVRDGGVSSHNLSTVRIVQSAAGAMTPEIVRAIYGAFPNAEINYGWGQSESGSGITMRLTREMLEEDSPLLDALGKPMDEMEIRIVDDEGDDVAPGEPGEALVKSPAVMSGYYGQPEITANTITPDGWLHTGDVMRVDENGYYYLCARKKDMIKSGGENVFINEVQTAILRNPDVADCVVFGTSDPVMGEAVAAVVQPVKGKTLTAQDVQEACKAYIASYKKPRYVLFVDNLGRDDAGKIRMKNVVAYFDAHVEK